MLDLRFPGQQYDSATGFNYNYFRDYDPSTGRYLESDPIGLGGGNTTYGYSNGNPILYADQFALESALILVGDPGTDSINVGRGFDRGAQTFASEISGRGYDVVVKRVSSLDDFKAALISVDDIGAVYYFGHAGPSGLGVGNAVGANVYSKDLKGIDYSHLRRGAPFVLFACHAGSSPDNDHPSFAYYLAYESKHPVYAWPVGLNQRGDSGWTPYKALPGSRPPAKGPLYWRPEDGSPATKFDPWGGR